MKRNLLFFVLVCSVHFSTAQSEPGNADDAGKKVLKRMMTRYKRNWFSTLTFYQTTRQFKNDRLVKTQTWYEVTQFPDKFRIDFGDRDSGNAVIFRHDSAYTFRNGKQSAAGPDQDDLTFLLGGMYFLPGQEVWDKMRRYGFDLSKLHETVWKGQPVYVIGASSARDRSSQFWIEKRRLIIVRVINYVHRKKEDVVLEGQVPLGGGFTETKATIYIDNKLAQEELYHDWKGNVRVDPQLFDPACFGKDSARWPSCSPQLDTPVAGVWKGTSLCQVKNSPCHDEIVVYHIVEGKNRNSFEVTMNKVIEGKEEEMGTLDMRWDRTVGLLTCTDPYGNEWQFRVTGALMEGRVIHKDMLYRLMHLTRQSPK